MNYCFSLHPYCQKNGGLAQLARALAWHARGHRFDSDILHQENGREARVGQKKELEEFSKK